MLMGLVDVYREGFGWREDGHSAFQEETVPSMSGSRKDTEMNGTRMLSKRCEEVGGLTRTKDVGEGIERTGSRVLSSSKIVQNLKVRFRNINLVDEHCTSAGI